MQNIRARAFWGARVQVSSWCNRGVHQEQRSTDKRPPGIWSQATTTELACVASVSTWFRSKERPVLAARKIKREPKNERGGGEGNLSSPSPLRPFTCAIFRAVFDFRSSFFAPKPHGDACYGGYDRVIFSDLILGLLKQPPRESALGKRLLLTL